VKNPGASAPWRDLSRYRRYGPKLEADEERLLIALAQSGNDAAGWRLHQAFHGKVRGLAGKHVPRGQSYFKKRPGHKKAALHTSELFEDLVAAGHLALWEAIKGYSVNLEYRLWTFAAKSVSGAIRDASYAFRRHVAGVSRIDRWLFGHWNARAEDLLAASKGLGLKKNPICSLLDAERYIEVFCQRYSKQELHDDRDDLTSLYDFYRQAPIVALHRRVSDVIDDLARGRDVEPERYKSIMGYFDKKEQRWTKQTKLKTKPQLPLLRPRHWHMQLKKRQRKNYVQRVQSAEGRL
jgi:hypothetical protein